MKKFLNISHKSLNDSGVATYKELWEKAQKEGFTGIALCLSMTLEKSAENTFHAVFSTASEDRHGDIVMQDWDLASFKKNPVFLDSHNYDSIEHILGRVVNIKQDKILEGDIEFNVDSPKGLLAQKMAEKGFLRATSVGFIPKVFNDEGNILKSELLEISGVSVPANAEALFEKTVEKAEGDVCTMPDGSEGMMKPNADGDLVCMVTGTTEEKEQEEKKIDKKQVAYNVIKRMADKHNDNLKKLAKAVQELTDENKMSKKREIHQIVRNLIKGK